MTPTREAARGGLPTFVHDRPLTLAALSARWSTTGRSLAMLEDVLTGHPLVAQLRFELEAMRDFPPRGTSREALEQAAPAGLPQLGSPVASGRAGVSR